MTRNQAWLWVGGLIVGSLVGSLVYSSLTAGKGSIGFSVGYVLGAAVATFVVSGIIPILIMAIQKFDSGKIKSKFVLWSVLMIILFVLSFIGAGIGPVKSSGYIFNPDGCEFSVRFPEQPRITMISVPNYGTFPEAEISDHRGLMRAMCLRSPESVTEIAFYRDRQLLQRTIQAYVEQNGLSNVTYFAREEPIGIRAGARGYKQISGQWATYEVEMFVSRQSIMSLMVGHISEKYPTPEISAFLQSVKQGYLEAQHNLELLENSEESIPGETMGNLLLQRDTLQHISFVKGDNDQRAGREIKNPTIRVVDTKVLEPPTDPAEGWVEQWTVSFDGEQADYRVEYKSDGSGGYLISTSVLK